MLALRSPDMHRAGIHDLFMSMKGFLVILPFQTCLIYGSSGTEN